MLVKVHPAVQRSRQQLKVDFIPVEIRSTGEHREHIPNLSHIPARVVCEKEQIEASPIKPFFLTYQFDKSDSNLEAP